MPIKLTTLGKDKLKLTIIKSPNFKEDLDRIKQVKPRTPIYGLDPLTKEDKFQHWEIPKSGIGEIVKRFQDHEIFSDNDIKFLINEYKILITRIDELPPITEPLDFSCPLYPDQEDYVRINPIKNKLICSLYLGAGKSLASLERTKLLTYENLIVVIFKAPDIQWMREIRNALKSEFLYYSGTRKQREKLRSNIRNHNIFIVTYNMLKEFLQYYEGNCDQIIIDEAHALSNPKTNQYKNVAQLVKRFPNAGIQELTATPINHKPIDLWGPVSIISPEIAGDYWSWKRRYEKVLFSIKKKIRGRIINIPIKVTTQNLDELQERLAPILYRVKENYKFEDITEIIPVELTPRQKELYQRIKTDVLLELENKSYTIPNALSQLTRLLQVSEGYFNLDDSHLDSGKLDYISHIIDTRDQKIIIWSRFKKITEILYKKYQNQAVLFNGDVSDKDKKLAKWAFQGTTDRTELQEFKELSKFNYPFEPGGARLFFGTISKSSSVGLNLQAANFQIFSSFSWNNGVNVQTSGRIKRINQQSDRVVTQFLVSENTIEETALEMILNNYKIAVKALDGEKNIEFKQIQDLIRALKKQ